MKEFFALLRFLITVLLGCLTLILVVFALSSCSPTIKYVCPPLSAVPNSTLDALEAQGRKDPNTASWVVDLDKHYQKLDVCKP